MALITAKKTIEKESIKLEIDKNIYAEIQKYCKWVGIDDIDHFFEQAATIIFAKDKDWKKNKSSKSKNTIKA